MESIIHIDQQLFLWLNGFHNSIGDLVMATVTNRFTWIPLYVIILFFIFRAKGWRSGLYIVLILICCVGLTDYVTSSLMKPFFARLRPCHDDSIAYLVHVVIGCGGQYGFVSSHAANSFALFTGLVLFFPKAAKWKIPLLVWAIIVSYSRIYVGVHYPADVLIGALTGFIIAYLIISTFKQTKLI